MIYKFPSSVALHVLGGYKAKDECLSEYLSLVKKNFAKFNFARRSETLPSGTHHQG
jgi:hypothetical protein